MLRERSRERFERSHLTQVGLRSIVLPREVDAGSLVEMLAIARNHGVEVHLRHRLTFHLEAASGRHHEDVQGVRCREVLDRERSRGKAIGKLRERAGIHDLLVDEQCLVLRIPLQHGMDLAEVLALGTGEERGEALDPFGALIARAPGQLLEQGALQRQRFILFGPRAIRPGAGLRVLELRLRFRQRLRGYPTFLGFEHGPRLSIVSLGGILLVQLQQQCGQRIVGFEPTVSLQVLLT